MCLVYNFLLQSLQEAVKKSDDNVFKGAQHGICDLLYNICAIWGYKMRRKIEEICRIGLPLWSSFWPWWM